MKNLNKIEMINDIRDDLIDVLKIVKDILAFDTNPEELTAKYLDEYKLDVFEDISKGLQGEFTRDKSIILGRGLLINYLKETMNDIDEDSVVLASEYRKNLNDVVKLNIDSLVNGVDSKVLKEKSNVVLNNPVRREYLSMKLDTILNRNLDLDLINNITIEQYLAGSIHRLESMNNKFISKYGKTIYEQDSKLSINNFKHSIEIFNTNTVLDDSEISIQEVDVAKQHEMLIYTIAEYKTETNVDKLLLMIDALDLLNEQLDKLESRYNELNDIFKDINFKYIKEFLDIYSSEVDKYIAGDIDSDKIVVINKVYEKFQKEIMYVDVVKYHNALSSDLVMLNNDVAVLDQLSDILINVINESKPN